MTTSSHRIIAQRRLSYTSPDNSTRCDFLVCISEPCLLTEESIDIPFAEGAASCVISFDGLPEKEQTVIGGDTFQALELALGSAEKYLRRLSKKYTFYIGDDPYFDD